MCLQGKNLTPSPYSAGAPPPGSAVGNQRSADCEAGSAGTISARDPCMRLVTARAGVSLGDYAADAELVAAAEGLRAEAEQRVAALRGRVVWMVNSTATGGGVAELLPTQVSIPRELGVDVRWVVIDADRPEFFPLTKRLHNMIHGAAEPPLAPADRQLYEAVSRANADALLGVLAPNDVLVVHDPQPLGAGALVKRELGVRTIWRCHIGVDERPPAADDAWEFLRPYATVYDRAVFSAEEYIPPFLSSCSSVVHPTIDPLSHKNRDLSLHKLVGILSGAALAVPHWPLITPPFPDAARRLQAGGTFEPATLPEDIGLLARPIILQVSRWDRLKGFAPLLEAFRIFKLRALRGEHPVRGARGARRAARALRQSGVGGAAGRGDRGPADALAEEQRAHGQRTAAMRRRRRAELAARRLRPHGGRGDVEAQAGPRQRSRLRRADAGARRRRRHARPGPGGRGGARGRHTRDARQPQPARGLGPERPAPRPSGVPDVHGAGSVALAADRPGLSARSARRRQAPCANLMRFTTSCTPEMEAATSSASHRDCRSLTLPPSETSPRSTSTSTSVASMPGWRVSASQTSSAIRSSERR